MACIGLLTTTNWPLHNMSAMWQADTVDVVALVGVLDRFYSVVRVYKAKLEASCAYSDFDSIDDAPNAATAAAPSAELSSPSNSPLTNTFPLST